MGQFANELLTLVRRKASEQGGIISGDNPVNYNPSDPLRLWVIQVGIIIIFTQLLSVLLGRIRQPRVIAEVIGGVLLGPSVMGHVPNFTRRIFPQDSIPLLSLTANIGLVFFLFLVGLEIDTRVIRRNARASLTISAAGLILPFGLGAAIAVPLYNEFVDPNVNKGYFILFVAVAVGITAFPVLCRILTECRLLDTTVGVVVLSAGVGNDIVGWILLALSVALVNAASGLTALWVLLTAVGYVLFVMFPVKYAFRWLARKTGDLESGQPGPLMMTVTFLLVLTSAFFTDIIGVHAIFGGFVAGLIIPHEGGFAIALVEKLEDIITLIFLPLYFAYSGLNTNLGLLNTGITWAYVVLICVTAFLGKFVGCFTSAKLYGFTLRESGAIGTLMACKGLVELIVLNVGFQAGILNQRVFSMFVLHALVLTFITTPLTLLWYPESVRSRPSEHSAKKATEAGKNAGPSTLGSETSWKSNFAFVLNRVEHLPALMTLTQLLQHPVSHSKALSRIPSASNVSDAKTNASEKAPIPSLPQSPQSTRFSQSVSLSALRLIELTERTSTVLKSQEAAALVHADPLLAVFRTFGRLHRVPVAAALAVVATEEFAERVSAHARERAAQMVVLPWTLAPSQSSNNGDEQGGSSPTGLHNPFEAFFSKNNEKVTGSPSLSSSTPGSVVYSSFVRKVFAESPADVALFVDRGDALALSFDPALEPAGHHLFLPFFGGPDDRIALEFVVQLCANPAISATVAHVRKTEEGADEDLDRVDSIEQEKLAALASFTISATINTDTVYGQQNTQTRLASDTADNITWARYATPNGQAALPLTLQEAAQRVTFRNAASPRPLHTVISLATPEGLGLDSGHPKTIVVVAGRGRRMAGESHRRELKEVLLAHGQSASVGGELSRTMGDVAAAFVAAGKIENILVMQAAEQSGSV